MEGTRILNRVITINKTDPWDYHEKYGSARELEDIKYRGKT